MFVRDSIRGRKRSGFFRFYFWDLYGEFVVSVLVLGVRVCVYVFL